MTKIKVNDNLTNIFNFIQSALKPFTFQELIQYVLDYDLYQEFYLNQQIIYRLYDEKIKQLTSKKERGFVYEEKNADSV